MTLSLKDSTQGLYSCAPTSTCLRKEFQFTQMKRVDKKTQLGNFQEPILRTSFVFKNFLLTLRPYGVIVVVAQIARRVQIIGDGVADDGRRTAESLT